MIDELDRIGTAELAPILNLTHQGSVFRFLKNHPDFPRPKKLGTRLSWARGAVILWIRGQPDREGGDAAITQRLQLGRERRRS
jgi:hypothetical protein